MQIIHLTPILNVSDIATSIYWFEALGWKRCWTYNNSGPIDESALANGDGPATFASVANGDCEIFLCKDGQGARGGPLPRFAGDDETGGVWMSWWLARPVDVDALHALAVERGFEVSFPPTDEPWGVREFHLRHPDGHTFRVSAGIEGD